MITPKTIAIVALTEPSRFPRFLLQKLFVRLLALKQNVTIEGKIKIVGFPILDIHKQGRLVIGRNVRLNSRNRGYFANLYAPVKFVIDQAGGEISVGENTRIHGSCIHASQRVSIGKNCLIAANCQIMDSSGHDLSFPAVENRIHTSGESRPVIIGDNVWIGINCIILPGVRIGEGAVIAAGSVVTKDIPPMTLAGGNPAKIIKEYGAEERMERKTA